MAATTADHVLSALALIRAWSDDNGAVVFVLRPYRSGERNFEDLVRALLNMFEWFQADIGPYHFARLIDSGFEAVLLEQGTVARLDPLDPPAPG